MLSDPDRALLRSARKGDLEAVRSSLSAGANINACNENSGYGALHYATRTYDENFLSEMIDLGVSLDTTGFNGRAALHIAVYDGFDEGVQLLLQAGANIDIRDNDGNTPLGLSIEQGRFGCATLLINFGAEFSGIRVHGDSLLEYLIKSFDDDFSNTVGPLIAAIERRTLLDNVDRSGRSGDIDRGNLEDLGL